MGTGKKKDLWDILCALVLVGLVLCGVMMLLSALGCSLFGSSGSLAHSMYVVDPVTGQPTEVLTEAGQATQAALGWLDNLLLTLAGVGGSGTVLWGILKLLMGVKASPSGKFLPPTEPAKNGN
jgi:hypothetical protein